MATTTVQENHGQPLSSVLVNVNTGSTLTITSSTWAAFSFVCPKIMASGYFYEVRFYVSAVSSSPTITAVLYSDTNGAPGSEIETGSSTCSPTGAGWNACSGFSATSALTEGTQYWVVLKITAGTNATVNWVAGSAPYRLAPGCDTAGAATQGFGKCHCTDSGGGVWTGTPVAMVTGIRFSATDGTNISYWGMAIQANTGAVATTELLCKNGSNTQEFGTVFTTPANCKLKVKGVVMPARKSGTPDGHLRAKLYNADGSSTLATSVNIDKTRVSSGGSSWYYFSFSSAYTLSASTQYRVVLSNSADDSTSNYYFLYKYTIDNDATSRTLFPFATIQSARLSGSTWTDTNTEYVPFALVGDTDGEYVGPTIVCPAADSIYNGKTVTSDGTTLVTGTLRASTISSSGAANGGSNLSAGILKKDEVVDGITGTYEGTGGGNVIVIED